MNDPPIANNGFALQISCLPRRKPRAGLGKPNTQAAFSLGNNNEYAYMINITIGGQRLPVALDTGSSDLWVVSSDCNSSSIAGVPAYNRTASDSLRSTTNSFSLSYLIGSVSGGVAFENVILGTYGIISQVFGIGDKISNLDLSDGKNSGILGLAFSSTSAISNLNGKTILENLMSTFSDPQKYFAIKLGREAGQNFTEDSTDSVFTVGQLDPRFANNLDAFTYTPVYRTGQSAYDYWKLPLAGLSVNTVSVSLSSSLVQGAPKPIAVLDTGTTLILGPSSDVSAIWSYIGDGAVVRKNPITRLWEVQCSRGIDVRISLGDGTSIREYAIHPRDMSWGRGNDSYGWCLGGIQENNGVSSGDWLLGDTFFRNVYALHHSATASKPPLVGLINLTDPTNAMAEFARERGPDTASGVPSSKPLNFALKHHMSATTEIATMSTISGFIGGIILTVLIRLFASHR